jgi:hypothetical protein
MKRNLRRYEVLFPLQFNDGSDVPQSWRSEAAEELLERFDGVTLEPQRLEGKWRHSGAVYRDNLVRFVVDVPDTRESRLWIESFKRRWKKRLRQLDIWIVTYRVGVI